MNEVFAIQYLKKLYELKFIKYCLTGLFNTGHHFFWFIILGPLTGYTNANVISFIIANITSFFLNSLYTFKVLPNWNSFLKYPLVMVVQAVVSYLVPVLCLMYVKQLELLIPIFTTIINLPIGYFLTKKVLNSESK